MGPAAERALILRSIVCAAVRHTCLAVLVLALRLLHASCVSLLHSCTQCLVQHPTPLHTTPCRCYKMDGLSIPEVKDCVKSAALGLLFTASHATTTTSLQDQLEAEVKRMVSACVSNRFSNG